MVTRRQAVRRGRRRDVGFDSLALLSVDRPEGEVALQGSETFLHRLSLNQLGQGIFDALNRGRLESCEYQLLTRNLLRRRS